MKRFVKTPTQGHDSFSGVSLWKGGRGLKEQEKETKPKRTLILFFSPVILKNKKQTKTISNEMKSIDQGEFFNCKGNLSLNGKCLKKENVPRQSFRACTQTLLVCIQEVGWH